MGTISDAEAHKALNAYTGRSNYTLNAAVYAKLHLGDPGSAGTSNPAATTTRVQVTFGAAASGAAISNTADVLWSAVANAETYAWVSFWDASSGGNYLGKDDLSATAGITVGESFRLAAGEIDVTISGTKIAVAEANKMLDAWAGRTTYTANAAFYAKLHTGDPGTSGTSNPATDTTRVQATFANAPASRAVANSTGHSWTSLAATGSEAVTWQSFWTAVTGGSFLGRDDLATSRTITTGDGLDAAAGDIAISIT